MAVRIRLTFKELSEQAALVLVLPYSDDGVNVNTKATVMRTRARTQWIPTSTSRTVGHGTREAARLLAIGEITNAAVYATLGVVAS